MTLNIWKTKTTRVNYSLQLTGRLSAFKHVGKQNVTVTHMIIGKLSADLLQNYRAGIRPSIVQWRNIFRPGFICEHERKEMHWHVTLGWEQTYDCSDWERKQLAVWTSTPEWRRRDSTARPMLLISLITYSYIAIIRAILGYCFLLLLFWQCEKSFLDMSSGSGKSSSDEYLWEKHHEHFNP